MKSADEEDEDLESLRQSLLVKLRSSRGGSGSSSRHNEDTLDTDIDDLDALRQAALKSFKESKNGTLPNSGVSNSPPCQLRASVRGQGQFPCPPSRYKFAMAPRRGRYSNLIVIQPQLTEEEKKEKELMIRAMKTDATYSSTQATHNKPQTSTKWDRQRKEDSSDEEEEEEKAEDSDAVADSDESGEEEGGSEEGGVGSEQQQQQQAQVDMQRRKEQESSDASETPSPEPDNEREEKRDPETEDLDEKMRMFDQEFGEFADLELEDYFEQMDQMEQEAREKEEDGEEEEQDPSDPNPTVETTNDVAEVEDPAPSSGPSSSRCDRRREEDRNGASGRYRRPPARHYRPRSKNEEEDSPYNRRREKERSRERESRERRLKDERDRRLEEEMERQERRRLRAELHAVEEKLRKKKEREGRRSPPPQKQMHKKSPPQRRPSPSSRRQEARNLSPRKQEKKHSPQPRRQEARRLPASPQPNYERDSYKRYKNGESEEKKVPQRMQTESSPNEDKDFRFKKSMPSGISSMPSGISSANRTQPSANASYKCNQIQKQAKPAASKIAAQRRQAKVEEYVEDPTPTPAKVVEKPATSYKNVPASNTSYAKQKMEGCVRPIVIDSAKKSDLRTVLQRNKDIKLNDEKLKPAPTVIRMTEPIRPVPVPTGPVGPAKTMELSSTVVSVPAKRIKLRKPPISDGPTVAGPPVSFPATSTMPVSDPAVPESVVHKPMPNRFVEVSSKSVGKTTVEFPNFTVDVSRRVVSDEASSALKPARVIRLKRKN